MKANRSGPKENYNNKIKLTEGFEDESPSFQ